MKDCTVISFGEALIDRLGPIGGDPAVDEPVVDCFGGAPANVACALSRFGVDVSYIGSLGQDSFGHNFKNFMIDRGINTFGIQQDERRPTRVVLVRRDHYGDRSFEGFKGDMGLGFADQAISREQVVKDWPFIAGKAKWLITGTIPLASELSSDAFLWCIEKAFKAGIRIAIDLNWRPTFWRNQVSNDLAPSNKELQAIQPILNKASLIKLAKEEAQCFFNSSNPKEISSTLLQKPSVIVTDGPKPISWLLNKNTGTSYAISPSSIIDTTGAGDAFTAGLIYQLLSFDLDQLSYQTAEEIIKFAVACGAYVCQGLGAIDSQPSCEDVDQFLSLCNGGMS